MRLFKRLTGFVTQTRFLAKLATMLAATSTALATTAGAQPSGWPEKPIRLIVGFPAGGSVDQVARLLAQRLGTSLGQPIIVENRAGASGTIGTSLVAHAPADGYTLGMVWDTHAVVPSLLKKLPYDTLRDLEYVTLVGTSPLVLVTSPKNPFATFTQMVQLIKAGKVSSYGSSGTGSLGHLTALSLFDRLKLDMQHVPYKGGAPMLQDTLGQQVSVSVGSVYLVKPFIDNGSLRALAVTSPSRSANLPTVPTLAESNIAGFSALSWWGVVVPVATPKAVTARLNSEIRKALTDPAVSRQLRDQGLDIEGTSPEEFRSFVMRQMDEWGRVVKLNHVEID